MTSFDKSPTAKRRRVDPSVGVGGTPQVASTRGQSTRVEMLSGERMTPDRCVGRVKPAARSRAVCSAAVTTLTIGIAGFLGITHHSNAASTMAVDVGADALDTASSFDSVVGAADTIELPTLATVPAVAVIADATPYSTFSPKPATLAKRSTKNRKRHRTGAITAAKLRTRSTLLVAASPVHKNVVARPVAAKKRTAVVRVRARRVRTKAS
jgi:hypothetical protein